MMKKYSTKVNFPPPNFIKVGEVYLHPDDKHRDSYPPAIFIKDPKTFTPKPRYDHFGMIRVQKWGLYDDLDDEDEAQESEAVEEEEVEEDEDAWQQRMLAQMMASNKTQMLYSGIPDPTEQFVEKLIERKKEEIKSSPEIAEACRLHSLTIKICLMDNESDVWRIFRVPASTSLAVLHDQVISAVMGWARAYHGYVFEHCGDGSVFGPRDNCGYIDMMHARMHYLQVMDDRKVPLAALMRQKGDQCVYTYDLGDGWRHRLEVLDVTSVEGGESVELLDGAGACPPEDSNGLSAKGVEAYREFLDLYKANPKSPDVRESIKQVEEYSVNYNKHWLTQRPLPFKPLDFSLDLHRRTLQAMVSGPRIQKPRGFELNVFEENLNECAACTDRLRPLMICANCKKVKYCCRECQVSDWKRHKLVCKKK